MRIGLTNGGPNRLALAEAAIGHVHLRVTSIDRALAFYQDMLGFVVRERLIVGDGEIAFLIAGEDENYVHLALRSYTEGLSELPAGTVGLDHFAVRYPSREAMALVVRDLIDQGIPIARGGDDGITQAVFVLDPDGICVELCAVRSRSNWPRDATGRPRVSMPGPLDLYALLNDAEAASAAPRTVGLEAI